MLEKAMVFLRDQVNGYLKRVTGFDNKLSLLGLTDNDGKTIIKDLGMSLVNIEEETIGKAQSPYRHKDDSGLLIVNPDIRLNLYLLFTANFGESETNYRESLKFLSYVIGFFQTKNVFHCNNSPGLDPTIEKLLLELYSLPFEKQNYLWGSLGAKYLPSVMYKARLITVQEEEAIADVYAITDANLSNR